MENELDALCTKKYNNLNNRNEKIVPDLYGVSVVLWPAPHANELRREAKDLWEFRKRNWRLSSG